VNSTTELTTFLNDTLNSRPDDKFFISHGTYSSKPNSFATSFAPFQASNTKALADYCNPVVIDWIVDEPHIKFPNIVLLDYYERSSLVHTLKIANEYIYRSMHPESVNESANALFMVEEKLSDFGNSIKNASSSVQSSVSSGYSYNPFNDGDMVKAVLSTQTGRNIATSVVTNSIKSSNPFI